MEDKKLTEIKHVFFDLDRTLWDFEKNSETVIKQLLVKYDIERQYNIRFESFLKKYKKVNQKLWHLYTHKKITKEELRSTRFVKTFRLFNIKEETLGLLFEEEYIKESPYQTNLLEGSEEILKYLKRNYTLHVLTNGFKEVQHIKLEKSGIKKYFSHVFISEEMEAQKPHKMIFDKARNAVHALEKECLMIGDDYTNDIQGALKAGWKAAHLSARKKRVKKPRFIQIKKLLELKDWL
ncbi:MAG: YjjG family noncanonical pyrimidine nucleotidase [Bacteroidetes bacterium]|nr:YjjG family noncanonical pyrimidine nucleotidase [Bacteroidota bacterium]